MTDEPTADWSEYGTQADLDAWLTYLDARDADAEAPDEQQESQQESAPDASTAAVVAPGALEGKPDDPWRTADAAAVFLAPFPTIAFLCEELAIGPGRPVGLWGAGGSGKNVTVQAIALAIATGRAALNRYPCRPEGARVLHVTYDMGLVATALRYRQIANGMGLRPADIADRIAVCAHPNVTLRSPAAAKAWVKQIAGFDLVILDNARSAIPGVDENASDFGAYITLFGRACEAAGATGIYLHHTKKGGGALDTDSGRGTTAILAASGAVWGLEGDKAAPRTLTQLRAHDTALACQQSASVKLTQIPWRRSHAFDTGKREAIAIEAIPIVTSDDPAEAAILRQLQRRSGSLADLKQWCSGLHNKGKLEPAFTRLRDAGRVVGNNGVYTLARSD